MPINFVTQGVQLQNPLAQAAQVEQIRNYQTANALSQMKMAAAQKQIEDEKTLNALYQSNIGPDGQINRNGLLSGMAQRGMGSKAPALMKQFAEYDKLQNDNQTSFYNGLKAEQEAAKSELENIDPEDPHLPVKLAQWMSRVDKLPLTSKFNDSLGMTSDKRSQIIKQVLENPQTAKDAYYRSAQGLDKALQMHYVNQDLGGSVQTVAMPANHPGAAQVVPGTLFAKSMTPDQVAKQEKTSTKPSYQTVEDPAAPGRFLRVNGPEYSGGTLGDKGVLGVAKDESVNLSPKDRQNREAKFPQAEKALKSYSDDIDEMVTQIDNLKKMKGLDKITGTIHGISWEPTINQDAVNALEAYNTLLSKGQLQSLTNLRQSSPTGGALGNVSDSDTRILKEAFGILGRRQDTDTLTNNLDALKTKLLKSKENMKDAFDQTYEYRNAAKDQPAPTPTGSTGGNLPPPNPPPGRAQVSADTMGQSIDSLSPDDQAALIWANANPKDPRAAQIKMHLGVK